MLTIETQQDYISLVRDSRSNPFTFIGKEGYSVKDFETLIKQNVKMPKEFQISKAVKISYFPNGQVQVYNEYNGTPFEYSIESTIKFDNLEKAPICETVGITKEKVKDLKSLMKYVSPQGQEFFRNYLSEIPTVFGMW